MHALTLNVMMERKMLESHCGLSTTRFSRGLEPLRMPFCPSKYSSVPVR